METQGRINEGNWLEWNKIVRLGVRMVGVNLMDKFFAIVILATFSLWGCTPDSEPNTPITSETMEAAVTVPALATADETSLDAAGPQVAEGESMLAEPYPAQTGQAIAPAQTDQSLTTIAPSGVVDLSDIGQEQQTEGDGELIELPAPGVPNTSTLLIETAKNDLVERLNIQVEDVTLAGIESKEWPDSSLGCPAQDADYLTVLVDGFQITLEINGQRYIYHTDMNGQVILCENGRPVDPQ